MTGQAGVEKRVKAVIDRIRPSLQADGGDVEFVGMDAGVVKVRLKGACAGCPHSRMTLKFGIERMLKKEVSEVQSVESVEKE